MNRPFGTTFWAYLIAHSVHRRDTHMHGVDSIHSCDWPCVGGRPMPLSRGQLVVDCCIACRSSLYCLYNNGGPHGCRTTSWRCTWRRRTATPASLPLCWPGALYAPPWAPMVLPPSAGRASLFIRTAALTPEHVSAVDLDLPTRWLLASLGTTTMCSHFGTSTRTV